VRVTKYVVEGLREEAGANVTVLPPSEELSDLAPEIYPVLAFTVNVEEVTDEPRIGSLKVAFINPPTETPLAPFVGLVLMTLGGILSDEKGEIVICPFSV
jgi:hypothetical protein